MMATTHRVPKCQEVSVDLEDVLLLHSRFNSVGSTLDVCKFCLSVHASTCLSPLYCCWHTAAVYPPALSIDIVYVCVSPHVCVCVCVTTHCASLSSSVSSQHVIAIPWVLLAKPVTKPQDNVPVKTAWLVSRATAVLKATSRAARPLPPA